MNSREEEGGLVEMRARLLPPARLRALRARNMGDDDDEPDAVTAVGWGIELIE